MVDQLGNSIWTMYAFVGKLSCSKYNCSSFTKGFLNNLANDNTQSTEKL